MIEILIYREQQRMADAEDLKDPPLREKKDAQDPRGTEGAPTDEFPSSVGWI